MGYSCYPWCRHICQTSFFKPETQETASVDIATKEWLKSGLAEGVKYTDYIKIYEK
jgi:hypothetical protein